MNVYNTDAFVFINKPGQLYDRVILDFPDPHNEAIAKLYSEEFYTMLSRRLTEEGVVVTQSSSPFFSKRTFWSIEATLAKVFAETRSFQLPVPAFGLWGLPYRVQTTRCHTRAVTGRYTLPERCRFHRVASLR